MRHAAAFTARALHTPLPCLLDMECGELLSWAEEAARLLAPEGR